VWFLYFGVQFLVLLVLMVALVMLAWRWRRVAGIAFALAFIVATPGTSI